MAQWFKNQIAGAQGTAEVGLIPAQCNGLKDQALPQLCARLQLGLEFNPCPRSFHMPQTWPPQTLNTLIHGISGSRTSTCTAKKKKVPSTL